MKKKSLSRHTNISLNLTPHYKSNKFAGGGAFDNLTTASFYDDSTKATLNNTGGSGSVGGVFAGVEGMLESGLQNAKLNSTYNIQSDIADNLGQALGNQNLNTNDSLMEAWDNYNPLEHVHYHDIRGGSTFGRIWNTNMASIKGAEAGWNTGGGPWAAAIGGVVGLGAGIGGWLAGDKKAARLKRKLNNEIDIVNDFGYTNIANQQTNVERKNLLRAEGNYVAYGGDLNNTWLDKDFARQQMQGLYNNGIARKYPKGGNINIAIGQTSEQQQQPQQQEQQKSTIESLLPYIMAAKQAREQREAAALLAQQQLARTQNQEPVYAQQAYSYNQNQQQPTTQVQTKSAYYVDPSDELYNSIMGFEGFLPRPEWDVDGYAIGYGDHNKELVDYYLTHKGEKYTKEEGSKLVKKTVGEVRKILSENIPNWNELTGPQQDALTSYGYNTGPWAIINHSPSLMKALAEKDWKKAATHINRGWYQKDNRGRELLGLRKRRNYERLPFLYPEMTTYGVLPDGTVVNPDDLLKVDLSKPYSFENGVWKNIYDFPEDSNETVPVFVSNAFGGNLFEYGGPKKRSFKTPRYADPMKEKLFQNWYKEFASKNNLDPNPDDYRHYYDYRAYWEGLNKVTDPNNTFSTAGTHLPDTYKLPGHPTMSAESNYQQQLERGRVWQKNPYPMLETESLRPETDAEFERRSGLTLDQIKEVRRLEDELRADKQRYAESSYNNNAVSSAGAKGAYQIMPITQRDYMQRGHGEDGDLFDLAYNRKVRDYSLNRVPIDLGNTYSNDNPEIIRLAKEYAGYNWGAGNLKRYLNKQRAAGIDTENSLDWIEGLPKETSDYVKFIVLDQDVPGTSKTYNAFRKKADSLSIQQPSVPNWYIDKELGIINRRGFANGGNLFKNSGKLKK